MSLFLGGGCKGFKEMGGRGRGKLGVYERRGAYCLDILAFYRLFGHDLLHDKVVMLD